jgi:ubiquinone/menaquinone biosynthesis C-methylase UbiE
MTATEIPAPQRVEFDPAVAQRLTAVYMTPDVIEQRRQTLAALALRPGERVVDIGGAPGYLALDMALLVGTDGSVSVVDSSESMLQAARDACAQNASIDIRLGDAQALPFSDAEFDVAVSTQVLEFVPDVDGALAEVNRVLKPSGRLLVLDTDVDTIVWSSSDAELTRRLLIAWEQRHTDAHLPRTLLSRLRRAGFGIDGVTVIPVVNTAYDATQLSFHLSKQIAQQAEKSGAVTSDEAQTWLHDLEERGRTGGYFFSLNRHVFTAHRP